MSTPPVPLQGSPIYRAYRVGLNGHIITSEYIAADNDVQAALGARTLATIYPIELWDRARFLGRFEPNPSQKKGRPEERPEVLGGNAQEGLRNRDAIAIPPA